MSKEYYQYNDKKFYSLSALLLYFASDVKYWQDGKNHYYRNLLTNWLEERGEEREAKEIEKFKENQANMDLAFFTLIYHYHKNLNFYLFGQKIDEKILLQLIRKYIQNHSSVVETLIVDMLIEGKLKLYYDTYLKITKVKPTILKEIINKCEELDISNPIYTKREKREKFEQLFAYLELISTNRNLYYIPKNLESFSIEEIYRLSISKDRFDRINKRYNLPIDLIRAIENGECNFKAMEAIKRLDKFKKEKFLIPKDFDEKLSKEFFKTIEKLSFLIEKEKFKEYQNIFFIPKVVRDAILKGDFETYLSTIHNSLFPKEYIQKLRKDKKFLKKYKIKIDDNISFKELEIIKREYKESLEIDEEEEKKREKNKKKVEYLEVLIMILILFIIFYLYFIQN